MEDYNLDYNDVTRFLQYKNCVRSAPCRRKNGTTCTFRLDTSLDVSCKIRSNMHNTCLIKLLMVTLR